jgi:NitT/TauT family transport system ATP-binding protein
MATRSLNGTRGETAPAPAPVPPARLSIRSVSKAYRVRGTGGAPSSALQVLRDVSFDLYGNEIVSLIGESGCGKTTLLRIVHGLIRRDRGDVAVNGRVVTGPGPDRGIVFQQANLLPWRSARRNVEFGLEMQGMDKAARRARALELLDLVGLGRFHDRYPHQLSGGMQQRVGLARALAINPDVLLMDEPFSALDAQTREVLQQEVLRIQAETDQTVLFVTHDLDEAIYLSNRIVVLAAHPGRVKEIITVPFGRDRGDLPTLRSDPRFTELRTRIWSLISGGAPSADAAPKGDDDV